MSEIRATTISNAAGTGPATLTGQSAAKAWVRVESQVLANSFNISSISDESTGVFNANFSSSFSAFDYSGHHTTGHEEPFISTTGSASYTRCINKSSGGTLVDAVVGTVTLHGDLA